MYTKLVQAHRSFCKVDRFPGESTFGLIKPDGFKHLGAIFDIIHSEGFYIRSLRMTQFNKATAKAFYEEHSNKEYFPPFRDYIVSGPVIGMRLGRLDAVSHWRKVVGPTNPEVARKEAPESIRAKFAESERINTVHGADSEDTAVKEIDFFFSKKSLMTRLPAQYPNTILMLSPQILLDGKLGAVVNDIQQAGCDINAMQVFDTNELLQVRRQLGDADGPKIIKKTIVKGNSLLMEIAHRKGYNKLLEDMLSIENRHGTGFSHFDRGEEKLSEKIFY